MVPKGGEDGTALQAASCNGNLEVVALLLGKGAHPNIKGPGVVLSLRMSANMLPTGGKYGTALQAVAATKLDKYDGGGRAASLRASASIKAATLKIATLLLENGADPNVQGASFAIPRMYY
jgi:ankyrin repeat protein